MPDGPVISIDSRDEFPMSETDPEMDPDTSDEKINNEQIL